MPRETEFTIGVNDEGTQYAASVNFGYDTGGISRATLEALKGYLSRPDVLGDRANLLSFENGVSGKYIDNTVVTGPELDAVRVARNALLEAVFNNSKFSPTMDLYVQRVRGI